MSETIITPHVLDATLDQPPTENSNIEEDAARTLAQHLKLPYVELRATVADPLALAEVPSEVAMKYQIVPLRLVDAEMFVAMADPTDVFALDDLRSLTGIRTIRVAVAPASHVSAALELLYSKGLGTDALLARIGDAAEDSVETNEAARATEVDPASDPTAAPIVGLINAILADAVRGRATDIHIEPQTSSVSVRYRVDGLLQEVMKVPKPVQAMVLSRLKILAGMDIAERRKPQAGRITLRVNGIELDSRASSIPTFNGEKFVLRLLRTGEQRNSLEEGGMNDTQLALVEREIRKPQGLIVFTGPTGSGKTSTMYALLSHIKTPQRNIVTLEDPIEYQLEGMNQTQIDDKAGITFASGLRTLLRQDPDVILVGEIRDAETAGIALHAANTGHLVLSSLHTNDAPSAVTRLVDLGIEPFVIAGSLSLVVAQRLVRTVCEDCAEPSEISDHLRTELRLSPSDLDGATPRLGKGCMACAFTGYQGRIGVYEVMPVSPQMKEQITTQVSESNISHLSRAAGVQTVRETAMAKAKAGITTFEEVLRVTREDDPRTTPEKSSGRPRILVVDDDPQANTAMSRIFSDYDVAAAMTAEEGLRLATLERPDAIILDLDLPDASGTDVIKQLRSRVATSMIPVLMLTGTVDKSIETDNLRAGVDDYITKPVNQEILRIRVEILLRRRVMGGVQ
jgi:type IV pilus assembly protein PilB